MINWTKRKDPQNMMAIAHGGRIRLPSKYINVSPVSPVLIEAVRLRIIKQAIEWLRKVVQSDSTLQLLEVTNRWCDKKISYSEMAISRDCIKYDAENSGLSLFFHVVLNMINYYKPNTFIGNSNLIDQCVLGFVLAGLTKDKSATGQLSKTLKAEGNRHIADLIRKVIPMPRPEQNVAAHSDGWILYKKESYYAVQLTPPAKIPRGKPMGWDGWHDNLSLENAIALLPNNGEENPQLKVLYDSLRNQRFASNS